MPTSHTIPAMNSVACKIALESKGKAEPDVRAMVPSLVLGRFRQTYASVSNFAATLAALADTMTAQDPKKDLLTMPAAVRVGAAQPVTSLFDKSSVIPTKQSDNLISEPDNTPSDLIINSDSIHTLLHSISKRPAIKQDMLQTEVTNLVPSSLGTVEPFASVIPSVKPKPGDTRIYKQQPNENSPNATTSQIKDTIVSGKHLQSKSAPNDDEMSRLSGEALLPVSTVDTAKSSQILDTPSTLNLAISPHALTPSGSADIISLGSNEQKAVSVSAPPTLPTPADQIAPVLLRIKSGEGSRQISLQLTPEALGQLDILIDRPHEGPVVVTITVSHQRTLDLLKTDHAQLSQALDRSGLSSEQRVIIFHLSTPSLHAPPPATDEQQQTHVGLIPLMSGEQSQSQFDQGESSGNQRRSSDTRTPYTLLHSLNTDAESRQEIEGDDTCQAVTSLYCINITA